MSKIGVQGNFYVGTVSKIIGDSREEKQEYRIEADIPGVIKGVKAFPIRDTLDEPKIGDPIILLGLDPEYNSYYLYWKLKENEVTGFRSAGKEIIMTPQELVARVYVDETEKDSRPEAKYDDSEKYPMEKEIASVRIKESGEIVASNQSETVVTIKDSGDIEVLTKGHNMKVDLGGGQMTLKNGTLLLNGGKTAGQTGPFGGFVNTSMWGEKGTPIPLTNKIKLL